jgi:hypothetical protein
MSFISDLVAGGAAGLFTGIGQFAKDIRAAITGESIVDPNKKAELLMQAAALEAAAEKARLDYDQAITTAQTSINALEAQSKNLFVSGWRPAVGWVCVSGLFYTFLLKPLLPWVIAVGALIVGKTAGVPALPEVPMGDLIVLLMGMLGLGVLRTVDKYNRVTGPPGDAGNR